VRPLENENEVGRVGRISFGIRKPGALEVASASTTGAQVDSCDKIAPRQASLPTGSRQVLGACT
jgi:hypothetical protein